MTTKYDPALCERLIAEAREDDARMTAAPWTYDDGPGELYGDSEHAGSRVTLARMQDEALCWDNGGIARTRNNLTALADQLEAARAEIERMRPVVEAAEVVRDKRREVSKGMRRQEEMTVPLYELSMAVDAYRAARDGEGGK